jgi:hypothetical protein
MIRAAAITFAAVVMLSACKKLSTPAPTLVVSLDPSRLISDTFTYKLGDTTRFLFTGSAGNVAVFTGDSSHNYNYRNRSLQLGTTTLSFSSAEQYGTQINTLRVLATDKLPGLDSASVLAASWTDITSRAVLATTTTATPSGAVNLSDLVGGENDSLFLAFEYNGTGGSTQRTWTITNFVVNNVLPDENYPLSTLAMDANYWTKLKVAPSTAAWASSTTQLQITGGAATAPSNTSWIVSKPIHVGAVAPDLSIPLINIDGFTNNASATGYNYKYTKTGTYQAVFLIFNNTAEEQKTSIQTLYVQVTN